MTHWLLNLGDLEPRGILAAGASDFRGSPPRSFKFQAPFAPKREEVTRLWVSSKYWGHSAPCSCMWDKQDSPHLFWTWHSTLGTRWPPLILDFTASSKEKKYFQATLKTVYFVDSPLNRDHWGPNSEWRHLLQVPGVLPQKISGAIGVANTETPEGTDVPMRIPTGKRPVLSRALSWPWRAGRNGPPGVRQAGWAGNSFAPRLHLSLCDKSISPRRCSVFASHSGPGPSCSGCTLSTALWMRACARACLIDFPSTFLWLHVFLTKGLIRTIWFH